MLFGDTKLELLNSVLDAAALRHKVIAQNIANVNTPGYRRLEVQFQDELRSALRGGHSRVLAVRPKVVASSAASTRLDGNNVDLEREYAALSRNAALFNTVAQIVTTRLAAYREAINGGEK